MATTERVLSSTAQQSEYTQRQIGSHVVDFAAGQPGSDLLPLDKVAKAAAHRLASPAADPFLLQYGAQRGYASFREQVAAFLTDEYRCPVAPGDLLITAGVSHGLDMVCRHLASPGDVVLVEQPTYFLAQGLFDQNRLQTVAAPSDDQGLDVGSLADMLAAPGAPKPKLLYLIPVHSNPRGITLPLSRRQQLVQLARQHGFLIIADEVYQALSFPSSQAPPPPLRAVAAQLPQAAAGPPAVAAAAAAHGGAGDRVAPGAGPGGAAAAQASGSSSGADSSSSSSSSSDVVVSLGSFSKIMAPGLRLGWIEAGEAHLKRLAQDGVLASGGSIAPLASGIAHSALQLGLLQDHLQQAILPALQERCAALCSALRKELPACRFHEPEGGYFVWLELPPQVDSKELLVLATEHHRVGFVPGPFCAGPPNCIRMSFSFYEPHGIQEGVRRLAAALSQYLEQRKGGGGTQ